MRQSATCKGEKRNACKVPVRKPEGKDLYARPRLGRFDNINMDPDRNSMGGSVMDIFDSEQGPVPHAGECGN